MEAFQGTVEHFGKFVEVIILVVSHLNYQNIPTSPKLHSDVEKTRSLWLQHFLFGAFLFSSSCLSL